MGLYITDDGFIAYDPTPEPIPLPPCRWCGRAVYEGKRKNEWLHKDTRAAICSDQIGGNWAKLKRAEPTTWTDAE